MTRKAALDGVQRFVDATVDATREEFSVARALRSTGLGAGGAVVDAIRRSAPEVERRIVEPELDTHRRRSLAQLEVVLDYAAGDDPIEAYEKRLLETDGYLDALDPDVDPATREAVVDDVLDRLRRLGDGVRPLVASPENEFWAAVTDAYERDEALAMVEEAFPFTGPLRRHREAFAFTVTIDPEILLGSPFAGVLPSTAIDYTDEALRAMRRAERRVVHETKREVAAAFDGHPPPE